MAELDIKWLQDKDNVKYFPVAHMNGVVVDSNGTTVASIINTLSGNVNTVSGNVNTVSGSVTTVNNKVTQLSGSVTTVNNRVTQLSGNVNTVSGNVNTVSGSVTTVNNRVTQLSGKTIAAGTGITITNNGAISATPSISLDTKSPTNYTGSGVTSYTVTNDTYGRIDKIAAIIYSATPITANVSNAVTVPSSMTGTGKSGSQYCLIFKNNTSTNYTIAVSTSYKTPDGSQLNPTCKAGGYTELNFLNIGGVIYVRGV